MSDDEQSASDSDEDLTDAKEYQTDSDEEDVPLPSNSTWSPTTSGLR